jgi:hypothetical protein
VSFLIDPALLAASGALIDRIAPDDQRATQLEAAVITTFVGVSAGLYINAEPTRWIWELCKAESGRDWMLNSGVFDLEHEDVGWRTHAVAIGIFATYPLWLRLGRRVAARRRAGRVQHGRV